ncbi:MAG: creatininase family protein [Geminicoccaceae bacterium]
MKPREILYERMTWPQLREAARADMVVLVPFGSIEQHGFHLPVDVDIRIAREVCERAARRTDHAIVMAPMVFGFETHHMDWPGTIDIDWDVLVKYGVCVCSSLARHGFRRILVINGHGSNRPILDMIVRLTAIKHPDIICAGQSWFHLGDVMAEFNLIRDSEVSSHADELETAAYLAIDEAAVDMSQAMRDMTIRQSPHIWADLAGRKPHANSKHPLVMMEHFSTGSVSGVRGDPTKATAEKGRRVLDAAAREIAEIVDELRAREIVLPTDYHDVEVDELKRRLQPK